MSRIGKLPVAVPAGVEVKIGEENLLTVKGPKGTLERKLSADMHIAMEDGQIVVTRTQRPEKKQSITRPDKNSDLQHDRWCYSGL